MMVFIMRQENKVLVCRTMDSFFDMCDNNLVSNKDIHCVFVVNRSEQSLMNYELLKKGGKKITYTSSILTSEVGFN